jgi:hypothetical protein
MHKCSYTQINGNSTVRPKHMNRAIKSESAINIPDKNREGKIWKIFYNKNNCTSCLLRFIENYLIQLR